ncbi:MAG: hypothetical protein OEY49_19845, partial [Candidatus Heimdallarchaeota archaeon]|nr:hypothetical protein [Candidatus Heimdallarchaeota archaeon]
RLAHKIDAERIYRSLIDLEKGVMNNYRQIMHLIDLLLNELKLTGEKEVYNEILYYSNLMFDEVKSKNDFSTLPRLYSQKSRLLLVNGKFDEAEELLIEAKEFFKENKLFALEEIVANELDLIKNEFSKQRQIIESNVSFAEKIDKLHLVDYINQIVRNTK